jgi:copper(I)-binding protein
MLFGALAVLVPALAGCEAGFNAPTLTYHPAAFGGYATHDGISIDNAFVVASSTGVAVPRAGLFFSVTSRDGDRLVSISAPGTAPLVRIAGGAVNLPADMPVDLTGPVPQVVLTGLSSPLMAGSVITMTFNFAKAGAVTMGVPVEPHAYQYVTDSPPPALPTPKPSASGSASASASPTATP